jgi:outer membrane protein TolC
MSDQPVAGQRVGLGRMRPTLLLVLAVCVGCESSLKLTDRDVAEAIRERQQTALQYDRPVGLGSPYRSDDDPGRDAYQAVAVPTTIDPPEDFVAPVGPRSRGAPPSTASAPASEPVTDAELGPTTSEVASQIALTETQPVAATQPRRHREQPLTLISALGYAQQHRREYQTAKEDLYLVALALTVERHLWTPQFAAELRTVYGNFGEATGFDQAMRFVSDLSVAQRLPLGGQLTARAISTLIRDVGQSITAAEGSAIELGLEIPLLRGAGHVALENLIQLQRSLTYAVRSFERFRRQQLVLVARGYFELLRLKQDVLDAEESVRRAQEDFAFAAETQKASMGRESDVSPLDTRRAEQRMLSEAARAEQVREAFRAATDDFKLLIGAPVDEPIGLDDLEDIDTIEERVARGDYPLLRAPPAAEDEERSLEVATRLRLDLLNVRDQIDDARRGVNLAKNALLPELNWNSALTFDTDPNHFNSGAFEFNRANWRTEMILSLNDRFRERAAYRASIVDVRRAERAAQDLLERVRADVRAAANQIRLQARVLEIQIQNVQVADLRREYASIRFKDGEISNRDKVEAESDWVAARSALNQAKTNLWTALLGFRLATETLRVDEEGVQYDDAVLQ